MWVIFILTGLLAFLTSPVLILYGLVFPQRASRMFKRDDLTRKQLSKRFGGVLAGSIALLVTGTAIAPPSETKPATEQEQATAQVAESKGESETTNEQNGQVAGSSVSVGKSEPEEQSGGQEKSFDQDEANDQTASLEGMEKATIVSVTDGDTLKVNLNGTQEKLRVVGIDTPETVDPRKPVQCFGKEATAKMKSMVKNGQTVYLEPDQTQSYRDKYKRLLRFVFLEDGTDVGLTLIKEGYASEYTYNSNPYKYQSAYKAAEKEARENKRGLWADNACPATPAPTAKPTTPPSNTGSGYVPPTNTGGSWGCDCSKTCANMSSCAEAQYQLNTCGCSRRDGDKDGIACDSDCQ